jgi:3-isopropylmalate/(R)-2-methylmalate dehydratase small subunit
MKPFTKLTAIAAPMPMINIDTDMIIPKQFLRTIKRTGLGEHLFNDMRFDENGQENREFVLNKEPYRNAEIIVAGDNFGCGSSREHAPWALLDFGISCVIAPSFADIFFNNCFKNGILPIEIKGKNANILLEYAANENVPEITVDLNEQTIKAGDLSIQFEIEEFRKHCLLNGLDDIGMTLEKEGEIAKYEARNKEEKPWLWQ